MWMSMLSYLGCGSDFCFNQPFQVFHFSMFCFDFILHLFGWNQILNAFTCPNELILSVRKSPLIFFPSNFTPWFNRWASYSQKLWLLLLPCSIFCIVFFFLICIGSLLGIICFFMLCCSFNGIICLLVFFSSFFRVVCIVVPLLPPLSQPFLCNVFQRLYTIFSGACIISLIISYFGVH